MFKKQGCSHKQHISNAPAAADQNQNQKYVIDARGLGDTSRVEISHYREAELYIVRLCLKKQSRSALSDAPIVEKHDKASPRVLL